MFRTLLATLAIAFSQSAISSGGRTGTVASAAAVSTPPSFVSAVATENTYPENSPSFAATTGDLIFAFCSTTTTFTGNWTPSTSGFTVGSWTLTPVYSYSGERFGAMFAKVTSGGTGYVTCTGSQPSYVSLTVIDYHGAGTNTLNTTQPIPLQTNAGNQTGSATFSTTQKTLNIACAVTSTQSYWAAGSIAGVSATQRAGTSAAKVICEDAVTSAAQMNATATLSQTGGGQNGGGLVAAITY